MEGRVERSEGRRACCDAAAPPVPCEIALAVAAPIPSDLKLVPLNRGGSIRGLCLRRVVPVALPVVLPVVLIVVLVTCAIPIVVHRGPLVRLLLLPLPLLMLVFVVLVRMLVLVLVLQLRL